MNRLYSWLTHKLSLALEPHERDALHGDHAELGTSGVHALRDVLGLVIRRQLQLWNHWRPWLVLLTLVIPLGSHLASQSLASGRSSTPVIGLSLTYWQFLFGVLCMGIPLALVSWASGFAISRYAKRSMPINAIALGAVLFLTFQAAFHDSEFWQINRARPLIVESAVFFHVMAFLVPIYVGLRQGLGGAPASLRWTIASVAAPFLLCLGFLLILTVSDGSEKLRTSLAIAALAAAYVWPGALLLVDRKRVAADELERTP